MRVNVGMETMGTREYRPSNVFTVPTNICTSVGLLRVLALMVSLDNICYIMDGVMCLCGCVVY